MNFRQVLMIAVCVYLSACVSSHVMIGTARPPISPDQVKVYFHPPAKYEEIAMIDTSSKGRFAVTAQGKTDVVIERLKEEAASLGANGILLQGVNDQSGGSVATVVGSGTATGNTAYGTGVGFSGNVMHKHGNGLAIYVPPDQ